MIKSQFTNTLQSIAFKILLLVFFTLLAWQSQLHFFSFDWTKNQRNSLSQDSIRLIKSFDKTISFTLFSSPNNENTAIFNDLLKRYQYHQALINIDIINPDLSPEKLREHDINQDGALVIQFQQKTEKVLALSERNITNALQRLLRQEDRWIVFLEGHGERHPYGDANHDISTFAAQLASKGFIIESLNLSKVASIPSNTQVLVLASPQTALLKGEVDLINSFVEQGGNLLWLTEPNTKSQTDALAEQLNIEFLSGVIVDPNSRLLGLKRVDYALINEYPIHPITEYIDSIAIFPQAVGLFISDEQTVWHKTVILETQANTWNETGEMKGEITFGDHSDEVLGPLTLGLALQRTLEQDDKEITQRIVVMGDGDFLSNQFLGNGANAELGFNILNWLSHDDVLISINAKVAPDTELKLSDIEKLILGLGFLIFLPLTLFVIGLRIWLKRKNR